MSQLIIPLPLDDTPYGIDPGDEVCFKNTTSEAIAVTFSNPGFWTNDKASIVVDGGESETLTAVGTQSETEMTEGPMVIQATTNNSTPTWQTILIPYGSSSFSENSYEARSNDGGSVNFNNANSESVTVKFGTPDFWSGRQKSLALGSYNSGPVTTLDVSPNATATICSTTGKPKTTQLTSTVVQINPGSPAYTELTVEAGTKVGCINNLEQSIILKLVPISGGDKVKPAKSGKTVLYTIEETSDVYLVKSNSSGTHPKDAERYATITVTH